MMYYCHYLMPIQYLLLRVQSSSQTTAENSLLKNLQKGDSTEMKLAKGVV